MQKHPESQKISRTLCTRLYMLEFILTQRKIPLQNCWEFQLSYHNIKKWDCCFFALELSRLVLLFAAYQTKRYFLLGCYYQKETQTCDLSAGVHVCLFTTCCSTWNLVPPELFIETTTLRKGRGKEVALFQGNQVSKNLRAGPTQHSITYNAKKEAVIAKHSVHVCTLLAPQQLLPAAEVLSGKFGRGFYPQRNPFCTCESVSS